MKKSLLVILAALILAPSVFAESQSLFQRLNIFKNDEKAVKSVLNSQVRYANRANFNKFISIYDKDYKNADGFDLNTYSQLVRDIWKSYKNMKYGVEIHEINVSDNTATVKLTETSYADIPVSKQMGGVLKSNANSIYYLKKIDGKWKVVSDEVIDEVTSMLYGDAVDLDIKLTAPNKIESGIEYTASLEFTPPKDTMAIASITREIVEYPQKQAKEVFRRMPEDNILERLFVANNKNANEYVMASIGLTKADISDLSIKLSLSGFGYHVVRVNVIPTGVKHD